MPLDPASAEVLSAGITAGGGSILNTVGNIIGAQASAHASRRNFRENLHYQNSMNLNNELKKYQLDMLARKRAGISTAEGAGRNVTGLESSGAPSDAPDFSQLGSIGSDFVTAFQNSRMISAQVETEKAKQDELKASANEHNANADYTRGARTTLSQNQADLFSIQGIAQKIQNRRDRYDFNLFKETVKEVGGNSAYAKIKADELKTNLGLALSQLDINKEQKTLVHNTALKTYQEFLNSKEYIRFQEEQLKVAWKEARTHAQQVAFYGEEVSNNFVLGKNQQWLDAQRLNFDKVKWNVEKKVQEITMENLRKEGKKIDEETKYIWVKAISSAIMDILIGVGAGIGAARGFKSPKPPAGGSLYTPQTSGKFTMPGNGISGLNM